MNHLEQLVAEWLQYRGYFVRVAIPVGPRPGGGYEGELDVVAIKGPHLLHVECSLDALSDAKRQERFALKFERGRKYVRDIFKDWPIPDEVDCAAVLQFASGRVRQVGGARLITVRELVTEIYIGLRGTSPATGAVSPNLPLLRTIQVAADAWQVAPRDCAARLIMRDIG